jgi:hypothetical protein
LGAALLLNVMTFCFFAPGYVLDVIQMMLINIATGIKLIVVQIQVLSRITP